LPFFAALASIIACSPALRTAVATTLTLGGIVASFTPAQYAATVATALGVPASRVNMTVATAAAGHRRKLLQTGSSLALSAVLTGQTDAGQASAGVSQLNSGTVSSAVVAAHGGTCSIAAPTVRAIVRIIIETDAANVASMVQSAAAVAKSPAFAAALAAHGVTGVTVLAITVSGLAPPPPPLAAAPAAAARMGGLDDNKLLGLLVLLLIPLGGLGFMGFLKWKQLHPAAAAAPPAADAGGAAGDDGGAHVLVVHPPADDATATLLASGSDAQALLAGYSVPGPDEKQA
jgi:hypothetical protein